MADGDRSLSLSVLLQMVGDYTIENSVNTDKGPINVSFTGSLANGTSDDQSNRFYLARRTASGTTGETWLLNASAATTTGAVLDRGGAPFAIVELVGAVIINRSSAATDVILVGNATSQPFPGFNSAGTERNKANASGVFFWYSPKDGASSTISATTNNQLKVACSSSNSSITYDVLVWGRSA